MLVVPTQRTVIERSTTKIAGSCAATVPAAGASRHEGRSEAAGRAALRRHLRRARVPGGRAVARASSTSRRCSRCSSARRHVLVAREPAALAGVRSAQPARSEQASFAGQHVKLGPRAARRVSRHRSARRSDASCVEGRRRRSSFDAVIAGSRDLSVLPLGSTTTLQHAFQLAASVVPRRVPAGRAHDQRRRLRCALAGAGAESLVPPGVERRARSTKRRCRVRVRRRAVPDGRRVSAQRARGEIRAAVHRADVPDVLRVGADHAQSAASAAVPAHRSRAEHLLSAADRAVRAHRVRGWLICRCGGRTGRCSSGCTSPVRCAARCAALSRELR